MQIKKPTLKNRKVYKDIEEFQWKYGKSCKEFYIRASVETQKTEGDTYKSRKKQC